MQKNVVISVKGVQKYDNTDPETVELVTEGLLQEEKGIWVLSYEESEMTGLEGTQTVITVEGEQVTLVRTGHFNSQMVFREGRRHLSMYNTPYGSLAIGVNTRHLLADLSECGGTLEVDYTIEMDHAVTGRNIFQIKVEEAQGDSLKH